MILTTELSTEIMKTKVTNKNPSESIGEGAEESKEKDIWK